MPKIGKKTDLIYGTKKNNHDSIRSCPLLGGSEKLGV